MGGPRLRGVAMVAVAWATRSLLFLCAGTVPGSLAPPRAA